MRVVITYFRIPVNLFADVLFLNQKKKVVALLLSSHVTSVGASRLRTQVTTSQKVVAKRKGLGTVIVIPSFSCMIMLSLQQCISVVVVGGKRCVLLQQEERKKERRMDGREMDSFTSIQVVRRFLWCCVFAPS